MGYKITRPSTIYAFQCEKNDKVYVGCTQDFESRIRMHFTQLKRGEKTRCLKSGRYGRRGKSEWQNDYDKYGKDSFKVYILEDDVPPEKALERECYWISYYDSANPKYGYNIRTGRPSSEPFSVEIGIPKRCANQTE